MQLTRGRREGNTGWDQGSSHPELVKLLNSPESDDLGVPKQGRALVPGCGMVCVHVCIRGTRVPADACEQGYDVMLFAQRGLDAFGLDISETGAKTAEK